MKLRNKKTGEIGELKPFVIDEKIGVWIENKSYPEYRYNSLAELNEEWEDYKEMKGYWFINEFGRPTEITHARENIYDKSRKNFGNYFETKEEAEKAVEKLKAWKRLKDKGFKFKGINETDGSIKTGLSKGVSLNDCEEFYEDMNLLFGGEE